MPVSLLPSLFLLFQPRPPHHQDNYDQIPVIRYGRESLIGGMLKRLETRLYMPRERIR
jgi:hypothetical protein